MTLQHARTRRRRHSGNMLMMAMALVLILAALVAALHHYEAVTRRSFLGAEADILMIQARKWELAQSLGKLPPQVRKPAAIAVSAGLTATENKVYTPDLAAQKLFSRNGDGAWDGLPNLIIKRPANLDAAAAPLAMPPNFREYTGRAQSSNASLPTRNGQRYRYVTGDYLQLAAFAPAGSIRLNNCYGWANPDMDDTQVKAKERYSGIPTTVAAGGDISIANMTHGTVYSANQNQSSRPIQLGNSTMAIPIVGRLPFSGPQRPDAVLMDQINVAIGNLTETARGLDDKTNQISGSPPTVTNMLDLIFKDAVGGDGDAVVNKMLGWLSVRSAVEFPFISLPGFAVTSLPGCYVCFQFWFHGPHPPDIGGTGQAGQSPSQVVEDLGRKLGALTKAGSITNYMLTQIRGGDTIKTSTNGSDSSVGIKDQPIYEPSGGYDKDGNPVGEWRQVGTQTGREALPASVVNPGLKTRISPSSSSLPKLLSDVQADYNTLVTAKSTGTRTLVTSGLKTDQSLLIWMADYQGYLYDDTGKVPDTGVDNNLGMGVSKVDFDLKATRPSPDTDIYRNDAGYPMLNTGILANAKDVFVPTKNSKGEVVTAGGAPVRDTTRAPSQYFGPTSDSANKLRHGVDLTEAQWKTIIAPAKDGQASSMTDIDRQIELMRFLSSTTDPHNPFNKVKALETRLADHLADIDRKKANIQTLINAQRVLQPMVASKMSNIPQTRKSEREDAKFKTGLYDSFQKGKGIEGSSYLRYGFSFDVMYNVIAWLADSGGDMNSMWTSYCPLVWWGTKDNVKPLQANGALDLYALFTVPQTRTFFYSNPVTIRGDLWLQRGSTMVVYGDLKLNNPQNLAVALASNYFNGLDVVPSGRIFLEEGATLIVRNGNLYCEGPVVTTSQPYSIRPITSAILVPEGKVSLRHGICPGLGLTDILQSSDLNGSLGIGNDINKYFVYPLLATVFPNLGKVYPFGPFHRRLCYFAKYCTQYQLEIFIGPFGIPIPIMNPWPVPRDNVNVTLYRGLSLFYAIACNINLGENLYPQCDWWPFRHGTQGIGLAPIFPKLNPKAFHFDDALRSLVNEFKRISVPSPAEMATFFTDQLNKFDPTRADSFFRTITDEMLVKLVTKTLADMVPAPWNFVLSQLLSAVLPNDDAASENPTGPYAAITGNIAGPFDSLKQKMSDITSFVSETKDTFENALMHEVSGILVYGQSINVGYDTPGLMSGGSIKALSNRPLLASGLFLASGDINLNCDYTIGAVLSSGGSINPDTAAQTTLLYYPYFTRASLYQPDQSPKITSTLRRKAKFPAFLARALDVEYGAMQSSSGGKALDVHVSTPQITAEGWTK